MPIAYSEKNEEGKKKHKKRRENNKKKGEKVSRRVWRT